MATKIAWRLLAFGLCVPLFLLVATRSSSATVRQKTLHHAGEPSLLLDEKFLASEPRYKRLASLEHFTERTLFGKKGPSANDTLQGDAPDCFLIAAFGAFAHADPQRLKKQFARYDDGTLALDKSGRVRVIFYRRDATGAVHRDLVPITTKLPLDKNGDPLFAKIVDQKLWVAALEKAFVRWHDKINGDAASLFPNGKRGWSRLSGGGASRVFEALSGIPADGHFLEARPDAAAQVVAIIGDALAHKRAVAAGSVSDVPSANARATTLSTPEETVRSPADVRANHAFIVLGTSERDGTPFVQLRDPNGNRHDSAERTGGTFELSLSEFVAFFPWLYVEGNAS